MLFYSKAGGKIVAVKTNFSTKEFKVIISGYNLGEFLCAISIIEGAV